MINRKLVVFVSFCILSISSFAQTRLDSIRNKLFAPENKNVLVASHRGDWRNACENSIEAIDNAVKMGVDIVEVDLARTKDGHLILMHDSKLDRTKLLIRIKAIRQPGPMYGKAAQEKPARPC